MPGTRWTGGGAAIDGQDLLPTDEMLVHEREPRPVRLPLSSALGPESIDSRRTRCETEGTLMIDVDWLTWLAERNGELLERIDLDQPSAFRDPRVTRGLVTGGWLGAPGASEAEIAAAEVRLGVTFPPSYRSFLAASDGFLQPDLIVPRLRSDGVHAE